MKHTERLLHDDPRECRLRAEAYAARAEPGSGQLQWYEVTKVQHYYLSAEEIEDAREKKKQ